MPGAARLDADRPIASSEEDLLERQPLVDQLVRWIAGAPRDDGFVVGVTGPWGSGKTSVLNLLANQLDDDVLVVRFDPWLFSGADQLVSRFFAELANQLAGAGGKHVKRLGRRLAEYGAAVSPAASIILGPAGQLLAMPERLVATLELSVAEQRRRLTETLAVSNRRIVVLLDDVDRLDAVEVREILRLVKLVADLPGVVHVLSYDRRRVECALESGGQVDGRAYLEKIVQVSLAVPAVAHDRLRDLTLEWLREAVGDRSTVAWDEGVWTALVDGGIDGYFGTLRDGRRWVNVGPAALELCADEVASMDVLALEALRLFDPDVHDRLLTNADLLTGGVLPYALLNETGKEEQRAEATRLIDGCAYPAATKAILRELFPAAAQYFGAGNNGTPSAGAREAKRVASRPVLLRYLLLTLATSEVPSADVDRAVDALGDAAAFRSLLQQVPDERLSDLIMRVRARVGEQAEPDVVGCAVAVLEVVPRLIRSMPSLDLEPSRRVRWLVEDLIESLPPNARAQAAIRIIEQAPSLSDRYELLYGFRRPPEPSDNPNLDLLDGAEFTELKVKLSDAVQSIGGPELAAERDVLWLVELAGEVAGRDAASVRLGDQDVLVAALRQTGTKVHPMTGGAPRLDVSALVDLAGEPVIPLLARLAAADAADDLLGIPLASALRRALAERGDESIS